MLDPFPSLHYHYSRFTIFCQEVLRNFFHFFYRGYPKCEDHTAIVFLSSLHYHYSRLAIFCQGVSHNFFKKFRGSGSDPTGFEPVPFVACRGYPFSPLDTIIIPHPQKSVKRFWEKNYVKNHIIFCLTKFGGCGIIEISRQGDCRRRAQNKRPRRYPGPGLRLPLLSRPRQVLNTFERSVRRILG